MNIIMGRTFLKFLDQIPRVLRCHCKLASRSFSLVSRDTPLALPPLFLVKIKNRIMITSNNSIKPYMSPLYRGGTLRCVLFSSLRQGKVESCPVSSSGLCVLASPSTKTRRIFAIIISSNTQNAIAKHP